MLIAIYGHLLQCIVEEKTHMRPKCGLYGPKIPIMSFEVTSDSQGFLEFPHFLLPPLSWKSKEPSVILWILQNPENLLNLLTAAPSPHHWRLHLE